jgi:hypothetical protein
MKTVKVLSGVVAMAAAVAALGAQSKTITVDLSKETVGKPPTKFQAMVGTWLVAKDGADKVIKIDGDIWRTAQTPATKMLIDNARKLYGTNNEELMDNAKAFANFPVAVLNGYDGFSNGTISLKFKTVSGNSDRASGILFNVKPNGDWLSVRYNDTENNVALWEFHNGIRRNVKFNRERKFDLDPKCSRPVLGTCGAWHELKLTIDGADLKAWLDGEIAMEYTLGSEPGPGRNGAAPHEELYPKNNAVLRPPVKGRVGLWAKTDTTSLFKDFVVVQK